MRSGLEMTKAYLALEVSQPNICPLSLLKLKKISIAGRLVRPQAKIAARSSCYLPLFVRYTAPHIVDDPLHLSPEPLALQPVFA